MADVIYESIQIGFFASKSDWKYIRDENEAYYNILWREIYWKYSYWIHK